MTIKDKVREILVKYPDTRTDNERLVARYWFAYHRDIVFIQDGSPAVLLKDLPKLPSADTISRRRREVQEFGNLTTKEWDDVRYAAEAQEREYQTRHLRTV